MIEATIRTAPSTMPVDANATTCTCGGDAAPFGHPLIYLRFNGATWVDCYYCGRRYAKPACSEPERA
jgi:uncharacterized Zn-finger protein